MEAVILTKERYNELVSRLDQLEISLESNQKPSQETFLDNQEFIQLMDISKQTAQTWRDEGKVSFSQIGSKIYFKMKDVEVLSDKNYNKTNNVEIATVADLIDKEKYKKLCDVLISRYQMIEKRRNRPYCNYH